ncbi:MAG: hypothetical protein A2V86_15395 [Deltaproteobacteria bacterium RBG_16_49_23]|nr:MAG: hypothetical protein A2V86_15395 [Deltaproteobacteria bacterium RBG_16_49_23]
MEETLKELNQLKKAGILRDYAIGGGYAVNYYLEPILTYDLDIYVLMYKDEEFSNLYRYLRAKGCEIENVHIIIGRMPVQFLPTYIHPAIDEAVRKARRIRFRGIPTKVLTPEHLIATLLMAFRPKDRMVIPSLLEFTDKKKLQSTLRRFSDEKTPLDQRLRRILESLR